MVEQPEQKQQNGRYTHMVQLAHRAWSRASTTPPTASGALLRAIGLVLLATLIGLPLRPYITPTNLETPYLLAVVLAAVWLGRYPAILTSLLSVIAFDLVFVPPYYTFVVDDAEYGLTFFGLLVVGVVISTLTARAREQEIAARRREQQTAALYELSQKLAAATDLTHIAETAVNHIRSILTNEAALFLPSGAGKQLAPAAVTPQFELEEDTIPAAVWVFRHAQPAGRHTGTLTGIKATFLPLYTSARVVGVMAVELGSDDRIFSLEQRRWLESFASQMAVALERALLLEEARQAHLLAETEKLQAALLNAISHDLRTPLATITGALSSLHDDDALLTPEARQELVDAAWMEARRLNRLVGNLLDMARLESGALKVLRRPADVQDLVGAALAQLPGRLQGRTVQVDVPGDLPLVEVDFTLMVQVLVNLIDNALKYSPAQSPIAVTAAWQEAEVLLAVHDRGPGVPQGKLEQIFGKFVRVNGGSVGGTGLGLSIAKGMVEAHNGRIWAQNRPGGGASFFIALPALTTQ